jgi:type IV fimbrial biogenesis protein FimT
LDRAEENNDGRDHAATAPSQSKIKTVSHSTAQEESMYSRSPTRSSLRGFTLQEMMVSLAITGTLAGGGASMLSVVQDSAMTAAANELVTHLALARSEAIKRHAAVKMCPSRNQAHCLTPEADYTFWQNGWLVYVDENSNGKPEPAEIVRVQSATSRSFVIRTSAHRSTVTYQPTGMAGGSTITFALCDTRGAANAARYVTVSNSGRARVGRTTTSNMECA